MIIKGLAGSEKNFVIDAIRSLLKQYCLVAAFLVLLHLMSREKHYILYYVFQSEESIGMI